jgi:glycosyltransferase involved in cell wall biosynthesis
MKVIICEYHPWDSIPRIGNHHYAREFLRAGWEVLWISHPVSYLHALKPDNRERLTRAKAGPVRHPDGPTEIVPYTRLPFYNAPILRSQWALANSHRFFAPPLRKTLSGLRFDKPDLLWITDTVLHALPEIVDASAVAVRIADDNVEFGNTPAALKWAEDKLCNRADTLFVTSSPLDERLRHTYGSKVHLLRNGVDVCHFQGDFPRPQDYADISGPIAVYVGSIEQWFDLGWVESLARSREDVTVVLIGMTNIDMSPLHAFPNIRHLGPKPYMSIPAYLAHADCGMIPFRRTRLVDSVSPLKLFEFLAAGLPVVSTRWMELENLNSPALLTSDADEFARSVSRVIDEKWKLNRGGEFREYARKNSWSARYQSAMDALSPFLAG